MSQSFKLETTKKSEKYIVLALGVNILSVILETLLFGIQTKELAVVSNPIISYPNNGVTYVLLFFASLAYFHEKNLQYSGLLKFMAASTLAWISFVVIDLVFNWVRLFIA